jgi:DNA-binding NtrC family response regulator
LGARPVLRASSFGSRCLQHGEHDRAVGRRNSTSQRGGLVRPGIGRIFRQERADGDAKRLAEGLDLVEGRQFLAALDDADVVGRHADRLRKLRLAPPQGFATRAKSNAEADAEVARGHATAAKPAPPLVATICPAALHYVYASVPASMIGRGPLATDDRVKTVVVMDPTILGSPRPVVRGGRITVAGGDDGSAIEIGAVPCVVGRDPNCQLVLKDKRVSAMHLELVATEHGLRARDLGSKNGTWLGDHRVVEVLLVKPASLLCGDTALVYEPGRPQRVPLSPTEAFGPLVGGTPHMRALFERLKRIARTDLSVIVGGETGAGKELVARAIHEASDRAGKPFAVIDCGAIPAQLAESELFGHEKGAFSGAVSKKISPFVEARGGTVFLDELGELPTELQPRLLRAVAEHQIKPVGSTKYVDIDVRFVAATRRDLPREIAAGTFRSDLFFRLADERVELPALRHRIDDIPLLVQRMMVGAGKGASFARITAESFDQLARHDWPGNVRELKAVVSKALSYDEGGPINLAQYLVRDGEREPRVGQVHADAVPNRSYQASKAMHDAAYFSALFQAVGGSVSEMSRRAGVNRETVRAHMKRHHIKGTGR